MGKRWRFNDRLRRCWRPRILRPPRRPAAVTTEQVEFTAKYSKRDRNKQRGGISLRTRFTITDPAAPAPLQLTRTLLRFPKGAVVNGRHFPKCKVDALRARGPRACPRGSKLGSGTARGAAPPIVDNVDAKVTLYNGAGGGRNPSVIIYSIPDLGPIITIEGVIKSGRGTPYGYVLDVSGAADQDAAERARRLGDVLRRDHARPHGAPARPHDPLHRQPGAVRRNVLPARRGVLATREE